MVVGLMLVAILLGALASANPIVQYLGNAAGVLLGFALGIWWEELQKSKLKAQESERFWEELRTLLCHFEERLQHQKAAIATKDHVDVHILEYRLPLAELLHQAAEADRLAVDVKLRRSLRESARLTTVLEGYIDNGPATVRDWFCNYQPMRDNLINCVTALRQEWPLLKGQVFRP